LQNIVQTVKCGVDRKLFLLHNNLQNVFSGWTPFLT
jgi:hypothetical protein